MDNVFLLCFAVYTSALTQCSGSRADPVKPFRLLDLPEELWLEIVKLAVEYEQPILINESGVMVYVHSSSGSAFDSGLYTFKSPRQPAITRVCHKIRVEALPHYYRTDVFFFDGTCFDSAVRPQAWDRTMETRLTARLNALHTWLDDVIKPRNARCIRKIYFPCLRDQHYTRVLHRMRLFGLNYRNPNGDEMLDEVIPILVFLIRRGVVEAKRVIVIS